MLQLLVIGILFSYCSYEPRGLADDYGVFDELAEISDWDFWGIDAVFQGLPTLLLDEGWVKNATFDSATLVRNGIRPENIALRRMFTSGLTRLSALRVICASHGLGFCCSEDGTVIISTNEIARRQWQNTFEQPTIATLSSPDISVRRRATFLMGYFPGDDKTRAHLLDVSLQDGDLDIRCNAAFALGICDAPSLLAVQKLVERARDPNPTMRWVSLFSLSLLGTHGEDALATMIGNEDLPIASAAAEALRYKGLCSARLRKEILRAAVSRLEDDSLGNSEETYLMSVASALAAIDDGQLDSTAVDLLKHTSRSSRILAMMAIAARGSRCEVDLDELVPMLDSIDPVEKKWACNAVWMARSETLDATDLLEKAMSSEDEDTRHYAKNALV